MRAGFSINCSSGETRADSAVTWSTLVTVAIAINGMRSSASGHVATYRAPIRSTSAASVRASCFADVAQRRVRLGHLLGLPGHVAAVAAVGLRSVERAIVAADPGFSHAPRR